MYYLSRNVESKRFLLSAKNFSKDFIGVIREDLKSINVESNENIIVRIKMPSRLYNEACERIGLGNESKQNHLVIWDKDTIIAITDDDCSDESGNTIPLGTRIPMSGTIYHEAERQTGVLTS